MKKFLTLTIISLLVFNLALAHEETCFDIDDTPVQLNGKKYDFQKDCIKIYPKEKYGEEITITEDYILYVDYERIDIDDAARRLLKIYYHEIHNIRDEAIKIGIAGAKIGLSGAKLGITAVASLPLLIFGGADEFEAKMETAGEELEMKGEELERRGDLLEKQADDLENLENELKERVDELDQLFWF